MKRFAAFILAVVLSVSPIFSEFVDAKAAGQDYFTASNSVVLDKEAMSEAEKVDETREHTYDKLDRLTEDQDGKVTTYHYNTLCQLITSQTIDVDGTITSDKTYTYDKKRQSEQGYRQRKK